MKKLRVQKLNASHGRKVYALTEGPSVRSDQVIVITAETTELASLILDEIDAGNAVSWPYMRRDAVSLRDGTGPIMGLDTPSGILCADCANDRFDERDITVRGEQA